MATKYYELRISNPDEATGVRQVTTYQLPEIYGDIGELLDAVADNGFEFMELYDALRDDRFVELGVKDIRLRLEGERPDYVYAVVGNKTIDYFGVKEIEVEEEL